MKFRLEDCNCVLTKILENADLTKEQKLEEFVKVLNKACYYTLNDYHVEKNGGRSIHGRRGTYNLFTGSDCNRAIIAGASADEMMRIISYIIPIVETENDYKDDAEWDQEYDERERKKRIKAENDANKLKLLRKILEQE